MSYMSTYMSRGPTELVQHSVFRRTSHRRKGAASHIIDMVRLYRSSIPVGRRGAFHLFIWRLLAFAAPPMGRGGGVSQHPVFTRSKMQKQEAPYWMQRQSLSAPTCQKLNSKKSKDQEYLNWWKYGTHRFHIFTVCRNPEGEIRGVDHFQGFPPLPEKINFFSQGLEIFKTYKNRTSNFISRTKILEFLW